MGFLSLRLSFSLSNARWLLTANNTDRWKIVYDLKSHRWGDELTMPSGQDLLAMPGYLHLTGIETTIDEGKAIGSLHYLEAYEGSDDGVIGPSPDSFSIECVISLASLRELIRAEQMGSGPTTISVFIPEGIKYGVFPDGSDKIWAAEGKDWVAIDELSLSFEPQKNIEAPEEVVDEVPSITELMRSEFADFKKIVVERTFYILGALAVIAVLVALK